MRCEDAIRDMVEDLIVSCPVCGRVMDPDTYGEIETCTGLVSVCESCLESATWTDDGAERSESEMAEYLRL